MNSEKLSKRLVQPGSERINTSFGLTFERILWTVMTFQKKRLSGLFWIGRLVYEDEKSCKYPGEDIPKEAG